MKVTAVVLAFADVPRLPEPGFAIPKIAQSILTRRYWADEAHMRYRFSSDSHVLRGGKGRLCIAHLLCDRSPDDELAMLQDLVRGLENGEQLPAGGKCAFARAYRLIRAFPAADLKVDAAEAPTLPHDGMQIACALLAKDALAEARQWWYDVHYPDCVTVPGWRAVLSLEPLGNEGREELTHMFLIDGDVDATQAAMNHCVTGWRAGGRSPAPRGISKRIFSGPYARFDAPSGQGEAKHG
jgi:hypothetical protein